MPIVTIAGTLTPGRQGRFPPGASSARTASSPTRSTRPSGSSPRPSRRLLDTRKRLFALPHWPGATLSRAAGTGRDIELARRSFIAFKGGFRCRASWFTSSFRLTTPSAPRASGAASSAGRLNDPGMAGMEYWMTQTAEDQGGAIYAAEKTGTIVYFDTDDIEASIAKVRELGGHGRRREPDPARRVVHAPLRHRGQRRVQPVPGRRVGRRGDRRMPPRSRCSPDLPARCRWR